MSDGQVFFEKRELANRLSSIERHNLVNDADAGRIEVIINLSLLLMKSKRNFEFSTVAYCIYNLDLGLVKIWRKYTALESMQVQQEQHIT